MKKPKTKAKAMRVYEVRLWSGKHFGKKVNTGVNIFQSNVGNVITKEGKWFHTPGEFLRAFELLHKHAEKQKT